MYANPQGFDMSVPGAAMGNVWQPPMVPGPVSMEPEDNDNSHRPPNAFILYSQDMRSSVRQENPSLSNTECSRLLGKMWKEVPSEVKMQYKQRAAQLQEEFKRQHPNYTYRKARRKRALNELLAKSSQGFPFPPGDPSLMGMLPGQGQFQVPQMYGAPGMGMGVMGQVQPGMAGLGAQNGMQAGQMPYHMDPSMYSYQQK